MKRSKNKEFWVALIVLVAFGSCVTSQKRRVSASASVDGNRQRYNNQVYQQAYQQPYNYVPQQAPQYQQAVSAYAVPSDYQQKDSQQITYQQQQAPVKDLGYSSSPINPFLQYSAKDTSYSNTYPSTYPNQYDSAPPFVSLKPGYPTVIYAQTHSYPTTPKPVHEPFLPAPPGQRPYCAKKGDTFCINIDYYPTNEVVRIIESGGFDYSSLFVNEDKPYSKPRVKEYNATSYYTEYHYTSSATKYQGPAAAAPAVDWGYSYGGPPGRQKRQAPTQEQGLCPTSERFVTARAAQNSKGDWKYVVNIPEVDNKYMQQVKITECASQTCRGLCSPASGTTARCEQQFVQKRLVALDGRGGKLYNDVFLFPDCCLCKFNVPG